MIKYTVLPDQRITIASLKGTRYDAVKKIAKMIGGTPFAVVHEKYLMPDKFQVVLKCDPRDEFSEAEGKRLARNKLMKNYYRSLDKRVNLLKEDVKKLNEKVLTN